MDAEVPAKATGMMEPKYNLGGYNLCKAQLLHAPYSSRQADSFSIKAKEILGDDQTVNIVYVISIKGQENNKAAFEFFVEYPLDEKIDLEAWKSQGCPGIRNMFACIFPFFRQTISALTNDYDGDLVLPVVSVSDDMVVKGTTFVRKKQEELAAQG